MMFGRSSPADGGSRTDGLRIEGLRAGYGKAVVLDGLDLHVAPGEIVGVAGPNGVGKTTLLRAVSGVVPRTADALEFHGAALPRDPVRTCARGIVHVPEGRRLFARLTVRENLLVGALGRRVRNPRAALDRVMRLLPRLEAMLDRKAGLLSGGQQQLVAVGRGLVGEPELLLVDELSLGLSPAAVNEVGSATVAACRERAPPCCGSTRTSPRSPSAATGSCCWPTARHGHWSSRSPAAPSTSDPFTRSSQRFAKGARMSRIRAVISGIGETALGTVEGVTEVGMCVEAATQALDDAGIALRDVDGLLCMPPFGTESPRYHMLVGESLGLFTKTMCDSLSMGGAAPGAALQMAQWAVESGLCRNVLVVTGERLRPATAPQAAGPR